MKVGEWQALLNRAGFALSTKQDFINIVHECNT